MKNLKKLALASIMTMAAGTAAADCDRYFSQHAELDWELNNGQYTGAIEITKVTDCGSVTCFQGYMNFDGYGAFQIKGTYDDDKATFYRDYLNWSQRYDISCTSRDFTGKYYDSNVYAGFIDGGL